MVALSGLSGSVTLEDYALLGGAVGLAPHLTVGKAARVAARSGVISDIPAGETWGGYPARPRLQWMRKEAALARLAGSTDKGKRAKRSDQTS